MLVVSLESLKVTAGMKAREEKGKYKEEEEGKRREGKGREGKVREGKGREFDHYRFLLHIYFDVKNIN